MVKRSPMRRYAPLPRRSVTTIKATSDFRAVYAEVDRRSEGRCEWEDHEHPSLSPGPAFAVRCGWRATDHHHTQKPRRSRHTAALIIHLCRHHHARCDWPYARGRASIVAMMDGRFSCMILTSADKFAWQRAYVAATRPGDDGRP